jgi:hypothetical protein
MPGANYRDWIVGRQVACSAPADLNSRAARGRSNRETRHAARNAHYCS